MARIKRSRKNTSRRRRKSQIPKRSRRQRRNYSRRMGKMKPRRKNNKRTRRQTGGVLLGGEAQLALINLLKPLHNIDRDTAPLIYLKEIALAGKGNIFISEMLNPSSDAKDSKMTYDLVDSAIIPPGAADWAAGRLLKAVQDGAVLSSDVRGYLLNLTTPAASADCTTFITQAINML